MRKISMILLGLTAQLVYAQELFIEDSIYRMEIASLYLEETREILVRPAENASNAPTLYLLDGRVNLTLVAGLTDNLVRSGLIPEINIVAINNYDYNREYDLSSAALEDTYWKTGGQKSFLQFLTHEVMPDVVPLIGESAYSLLVGHSFGGLFQLLAVAQREPKFDAYLVVSPSVWWNQGRVIDSLINENIRHKMFLSWANEPSIQQGCERLEALYKDSAYFKFQRFPDHDHITTVVPSIHQGLQWIFSSYTQLDSLVGNIAYEHYLRRLGEVEREFAITIKPSFNWASEARQFTKENLPERALPILVDLLDYYPESLMVRNFLAEAYQASGQYEKAKQHYQRSLERAKILSSPMIGWIEKRLKEVTNK